MNIKDYRKEFKEDQAVGWLSIEKRLKDIYGKTEPRHYVPPVYAAQGGKDPIDGTSIYDSKKQVFHHHIISFGMSELYYNEEAVGQPFSKWGFEFTFRLKPFTEDKGDPLWVIEVMNNLARYVYDSGSWFEPYQFVPAGGPIRTETKSKVGIVGLVFVPDTELGTIDTPHGELTFLQMVGITQKELDRLMGNQDINEVQKLVDELRKSNPLLITDLTKK